jgi:hypothetical protein
MDDKTGMPDSSYSISSTGHPLDIELASHLEAVARGIRDGRLSLKDGGGLKFEVYSESVRIYGDVELRFVRRPISATSQGDI